ncbi:MAG: GFA family protein, partial [Paracoccaceae bacterium]|nr:GFA family protein [Paracoccaceae bacterium]
QGQPALTKIASNSGKGQEVVHCPHCLVALYSHYAGAGRAMAFVRVGTLDNPRAVAPDIHIFTSTKLPWITLDDRVPVVPEYYDRKLHWPAASLVRRARALAQDQG